MPSVYRTPRLDTRPLPCERTPACLEQEARPVFVQESGFTVGILGWIVLGLIVGAIAKAILPGRMGGGWLVTLILGVVGALVGGFIGGALFNIPLETFWSLQTWIVAILGAILVLLIYGLVTRGRSSRA